MDLGLATLFHDDIHSQSYDRAQDAVPTPPPTRTPSQLTRNVLLPLLPPHLDNLPLQHPPPHPPLQRRRRRHRRRLPHLPRPARLLHGKGPPVPSLAAAGPQRSASTHSPTLSRCWGTARTAAAGSWWRWWRVLPLRAEPTAVLRPTKRRRPARQSKRSLGPPRHLCFPDSSHAAPEPPSGSKERSTALQSPVEYAGPATGAGTAAAFAAGGVAAECWGASRSVCTGWAGGGWVCGTAAAGSEGRRDGYGGESTRQ